MTSADQPAREGLTQRRNRDSGRTVVLILVAAWTLATALLGVVVLVHAGDEEREVLQAIASGATGSAISTIQVGQQLTLLVLIYVGIMVLWAAVFAGRRTPRRNSAATSVVMVVAFVCLYLNDTPVNHQWWQPGPTDHQSGPFAGLHFFTWDRQASAGLILLAAASGVVLFVLARRRGPRLFPRVGPGWYPLDGSLLYWDGTAWTSNVATSLADGQRGT